MAVEQVKVPDIGSSDPVDVIEVPVKSGDRIGVDDTIAVLESDKATIEVPSPVAGVVGEIGIKVGDRVREGDSLMAVTPDQASGGSVENIDNAADHKAKPVDETPIDTPAGKSVTSQAEQTDPAASGTATRREVRVPDLGDIEEAELIELPVSVGDQVEAEQVVAVLESDKASLEIPAPAAGTVVELKVAKGGKLSTGDVLLVLEAAAGQGAEAAPPDDKAMEAPAPTSSVQAGDTDDANAPVSGARPVGSGSARQPSAPVHAGPAVRKLAREMGVDLAAVTGTGPKGRIVKDDVHAWVKQRLATGASASGGGSAVDLPAIDFSKFGAIETEALNKIRRVSAVNLHRSWITIPHVTQHDEADITALEEFRKRRNGQLQKGEGVKLTMLAFLVKACAVVLERYPRFKSSLSTDGESLILKHYCHIGIAVDTPNGLVVPVLRDADRKGIRDIALEIGELAERARNRKLSPVDMQGACFSISSLGGIGGTAFTPVVNWPEVAILGVSKSDIQPRWNGTAFEPRLMLPLSLSYDHRVIDGADAARFTTALVAVLEDLREALL